MKYFLLLTVIIAGSTWSDLARQYPPASQPGLYSGTTAANTAGSGTPQPAGKELAHGGNSSLGHDYKDDRTR